MKKDKTLYWLLFIIAFMITLTAFNVFPTMISLNVYFLPVLFLVFIFIMFGGYPRDDDNNK